MTEEDLNVQLTLDGPLFGRNQERSLVLGPRSQMGELWVRLLHGEAATVRAVISEAFGYEMPSACQGCEDGPFPLCVAERDKACSNCIYAGSGRFCQWRTWGDHGAVGEEDHNSTDEDHVAMDLESYDDVDEANHMTPKMQSPSSPVMEYSHVPPRTQRAGRRRSNLDTDTDPDFVPPKRRKPNRTNDMHNYVPPKTRNASSRDARQYSTSPYRQARSTTESGAENCVLYEVIDLTGDD